MASPIVLQDNFTKGMKRDVPRTAMPEGAVWNLVDFIPNYDAPLRKRGGDEFASGNFTDVVATSSRVVAGAYFSDQLLAVDEDGRLIRANSVSLSTDVGAAVATLQNPVAHRGKLIITASDGTTAPKYYDGTTLGNLAGSPPAAIYSCVYKDLTVLAHSSANPTRLWFSDDGDPTSWDTTNRFWDSSFTVVGLAPIRNAILIFSTGAVERLRGSIPPPGSDMSLDQLAEIGTSDARSIAAWGDQVIWANPGGLYITDGAAVDDLTRLCGMKNWWQDVMNGLQGFSTGSVYTSDWRLVGGVFRNFYFYCVQNGDTHVDAGFIDLQRYTWHRLSNFKCGAMWRKTGPEELYVGRRDAARIHSVSPIFDFTNKNDANGTAVEPLVELPWLGGRPGKKRVKTYYIGYDIRDTANDGPELEISYVETPESTSYTALTPTATETSAYSRIRIPMRKQLQGIGLKIAQNNASSDTRVYAIEADAYPVEPSRL